MEYLVPLSSDLHLSCSSEAWKISPEIRLHFPGHFQLSLGDLYPICHSDNQMQDVCDPKVALATYDTLVVRKIRAIWGDIYEALELVSGKNF